MTLACKDANSKLVEVVTVADVGDEDPVGTLCRRSGLNPSSLVSGIFFHEPSSVSLISRGMIVPLIFV